MATADELQSSVEELDSREAAFRSEIEELEENLATTQRNLSDCSRDRERIASDRRLISAELQLQEAAAAALIAYETFAHALTTLRLAGTAAAEAGAAPVQLMFLRGLHSPGAWPTLTERERLIRIP